MTRTRCPWGLSDPLYLTYHDNEWGVPQHDDRRLFEMLVLDDAMKQVIQQTSALGDLQRAAEAAGLLSMSQAAWHMVAEGVTSVSEVDRVLGG